GAAHDEIADVAFHRLLDVSLRTVHEAYRLGRGPHAQGPSGLPGRQPIAAGSGINTGRVHTEGRIGDLLSAAAAGIGLASKACERVAVEHAAPALIGHRPVPLKPEAFERAQDLAGGAGLLAR